MEGELKGEKLEYVEMGQRGMDSDLSPGEADVTANRHHCHDLLQRPPKTTKF